MRKTINQGIEMSRVLFHQTISIIALALAIFPLNGCKEKAPAENIPASYQLHDIVNDGKTANEITLVNAPNKNRPKLRFPPEIAVSVNAPGAHDQNPTQIYRGSAYSAEVEMELNEKNSSYRLSEVQTS